MNHLYIGLSFILFPFVPVFYLCDPGETPTLLENSEGIHEFIRRAEETYNLYGEPVLTSDNIEHLTDKIPDEYETCLE